MSPEAFFRWMYQGEWFSCRMIIPWPAFLCWVTPLASPQTLRTSTRTTSSNCISSPTSTTSDQRANTHLRGSDALSDQAVMLPPGCRRVKSSLFLPAGGWRSFAAPRSAPAALKAWTTKNLTLTELDLLVSGPVLLDALLFFFYTYVEHLYTWPCTYGAFF